MLTNVDNVNDQHHQHPKEISSHVVIDIYQHVRVDDQHLLTLSTFVNIYQHFMTLRAR